MALFDYIGNAAALRLLERVKGVLPKVDSSLTVSGAAADAAVVGTKLAEQSEAIADCLPKNQGAANVGKILVVGTDGNLVLTDMPEGGASGDVVGTLDDSNNILLSGNIAVGTYTLVFENTDGTYTGSGTLEVREITPATYSITNNLTGCTTSNGAETVEHGASYGATITNESGYAGHTAIYVTMAGIDISATAVSGDSINIESVTGDITISCVAYKTNTRLSTSGEKTQANHELTGYISFRYGDTLYIEGVTTTNATTEICCLYDSDKNALVNLYANALFGVVSGGVATNVAIETLYNTNLDAIAYVRITANEINANSIITVNQPLS